MNFRVFHPRTQLIFKRPEFIVCVAEYDPDIRPFESPLYIADARADRREAEDIAFVLIAWCRHVVDAVFPDTGAPGYIDKHNRLSHMTPGNILFEVKHNTNSAAGSSAGSVTGDAHKV